MEFIQQYYFDFHVMGDNIHNSDLYFATNAHGTRRLAQAASQSGVRRFLYLSTIKVNGEERNRPYSPADLPHPEGMYAVSKLEFHVGKRNWRSVIKEFKLANYPAVPPCRV